jgi:hypothetical protein
VTWKTGFGFYDKIYWTFIQLDTTVHKSPSDTLSSSFTGHSPTELLKLESLTVLYTQVGLQRKHVHCLAMDVYPVVVYSLPWDVFTSLLPSNGCPFIVGCTLVGTCLPSNRFLYLHSSMLWGNPSQYCCSLGTSSRQFLLWVGVLKIRGADWDVVPCGLVDVHSCFGGWSVNMYQTKQCHVQEVSNLHSHCHLRLEYYS